jgi:hypothetical protein
MTFYTPLSEENEKILKEFGLIKGTDGGAVGNWFRVCISEASCAYSSYFYRSYYSRNEELELPFPLIKTEHLKQFLICNLL